VEWLARISDAYFAAAWPEPINPRLAIRARRKRDLNMDSPAVIENEPAVYSFGDRLLNLEIF
jgi:hypothetical protein